jgi:putative selenate reductase molybdopterin-binding subunit
MFDNKVRYVGDRVAAVAAETPEIAERALSLIKVEYEILEPVFDPVRALQPGTPVIHDEPDAHVVIPVTYEKERNLAARVSTSVGNADEVLSRCDVVVSGTFVTQYAQHCPIEPHITLCEPDPYGRVRITSSTQVPWHVRRIVAQCARFLCAISAWSSPALAAALAPSRNVLLEDVCTMLCLRTACHAPGIHPQGRVVSSRTGILPCAPPRWGSPRRKNPGHPHAHDSEYGAYGSHA